MNSTLVLNTSSVRHCEVLWQQFFARCSVSMSLIIASEPLFNSWVNFQFIRAASSSPRRWHWGPSPLPGSAPTARSAPSARTFETRWVWEKYGLGWTKHFSLLNSLGTPRLDTHRDNTIYSEASDFKRPCLFGTEWVVATDRKRRLCYDCFWNVRDWLSFDYRIYWK